MHKSGSNEDILSINDIKFDKSKFRVHSLNEARISQSDINAIRTNFIKGHQNIS